MELTPQVLHYLLRYEPETGMLFWKHRPCHYFLGGKLTPERCCHQWNRRFSGKEAFTSADDRGYKQGAIFSKRFLAHRVIWALHYGEWPLMWVDHINCNKSDNKLSNLRLVTPSQNGMNRPKGKNNKSGYKGVFWDKKISLWVATIGRDRKYSYLGSFPTPEAAHGAYCKASKELHHEHGRV